MAASAHLRLHLSVDDARHAVATALAEQGFSVQPTPSGALDVSRGSMGTTLVAGAFAGQDMHVRFDVLMSATDSGALAEFQHSSVGGFFKGGAIGAAKASDVVREAAHLAGVRLAQQGLLEGSTPAVATGETVPPAAADAAGAPIAPGPLPVAAPPMAPVIPPPVDFANRTNVVSIVALVLGFIVPLGGIIAGSVALAQVKRTGEKGRGLAIAGIAVGSVMLLIGIGLAIALVVSIILAPAPENADGSQTVDVFTVETGDCLNDPSGAEVTDVDVLECELPHAYEVFDDFTVDGDTFPGTTEIETAANDGCFESFAPFVGLSYEESTLDILYLAPSEESWALGDRTVSCLITDPAGATSGSLAGSGR